jgi:hypothetical protein
MELFVGWLVGWLVGLVVCLFDRVCLCVVRVRVACFVVVVVALCSFVD